MAVVPNGPVRSPLEWGPYIFGPLQRSSSSSSAFGLQSTLGECEVLDRGGDIPLILYDHGCNARGTSNCFNACQEPDQIFSNPYTFQNCIVLLILNATPGVGPSNISDVAIADEFSIPIQPDQTFGSLVSNTIKDCFSQYCDISSNCRSSDTRCPIKTSFSYDINQICGGIFAPLNADIGGIGVFISYWMQSGIALSAFSLLKLCEKMFYRLAMFLVYITWPLWWGFPRPYVIQSIRLKANKIQTLLQKSLPIIKSATVEFHKAQCFFMLSIEIAAQIVIKQGSLNQGQSTLQGLFNNYSLIGSLSISGVLPITFTLLALHTVGMRSLYLLVLSSCTVAMSAATLVSIGDFNVSPPDFQRITASTSDRYPKCGARDPTIFCLDLPANSAALTSMKLGQGAVGGSSLVLSLLILMLLFLDSLSQSRFWSVRRPLARQIERFDSAIQRLGSRTQYKNLQWTIESRRCLLYVLVEVLYAIIWTLYIVLFIRFLNGLTYPSNGAKTTPVDAWTFGQIVAITVWAVPLFEFAKLSIEGIEQGLDYRTPRPYRITKINEATGIPDPIEKSEEDSPTKSKQNNEVV